MTTLVYFQLIEWTLVLMLLHISVSNHSHLQGVTNVEKKKHVGALKWIIVQVFGNELVCIRHLHELCILSNIEKTGWGSCKENF